MEKLKELAKLSDDELSEAMREMSADDLAALEKHFYTQSLIYRSRVFSEDGFNAFFEYMHGSPLHREGRKWVANLFRAIDGVRKLLEECFRGSGKSTVMSKMFGVFYIGHHPHTTNAIIRVNGQKAKEATLEIADVISKDERFRIVFPNVVPAPDRWGEEKGYTVMRTDVTEEEWRNICREASRPSGATLIGYGVDSGSIQGLRTNGFLIVDDIHVKENTRSPRQLKDVKDFVREQLQPIPVPNVGVEIWNFTPWLDNDAYAERKQTGLYIHSRSPIMERVDPDHPEAVLWPEVMEWPQNIVEARERGEITFDLEMSFPFAGKYWKLAWPERWGIVEIAMKYADVGNLAFAREYLLDLTALQGKVLRREWLSYFPATSIDPSWPVFVGVDYASVSDKLKHRERDYAAFAIGRAIPGGGLVLTGGYFGHYTKPESLKILQRIKEGYPTVQLFKVETLGKGEEFYNDALLLKDTFGVPLPLSALETHGKASKGERFEDYLGPRFESRRLWVSDETNDFIEEFVDEWLSFPNGRYDDVIDAVYHMAVGGEGFTPTTAERSFYKKNTYNPFAHLNEVVNA